MKKVIGVVASVAVVCALVFCLSGCGAAKTSDLSGTWKQTNASSDTSMEAVISGDTITVNWVGADSTSLYWAGTYVAPSEATDSYTWDSIADKDKTSKSMLASGDDTKTFTYSNGVLSYSASAMGTTTTVEMKKN